MYTGIEVHPPAPGQIPLFDQWQAAKNAGLDLFKWDAGDYPVEFMERVIAFHMQEKAVAVHEEDAKATETERRIKPKGNK